MRRPHALIRAATALLLAAALADCGDAETSDHAPVDTSSTRGAGCLDAEAQALIDRFGRSLQQVSLLAPDSLLDASLREHYGALVTPALLEQWTDDPATAPGRLTSSPWPDRIEMSSAVAAGDACVVQGEIVYATSSDTTGNEALREPVTIRLDNDDGWRISGFEQENGAARAGGVSAPGADPGAGASDTETAPDDGADAGEADPQQAAAVIRSYYQAIAAGDYARAYRLWSNDGAASGQTLQEFTRGYAETASVQADVGAPTDMQGAAGSVYVEVPVVVRAVTTEGERQHFEGTYTLRRSNVDGATAEQRAWRIYDATISAARDDTDEPDA